MKRAFLLGSLAVLLACGKANPDAPSPAAPVALPKPPVVSDAGGPYVLRYFSPASGQLLVARTVAEVPEGARGQVLVDPEDPELQGPWLFVADLTQKTATGYEVHVMDRAEVEKRVVSTQAAGNGEGACAPGASAETAPPEPAVPGAGGAPASTGNAPMPAGGAPPAVAGAVARDNDVIIYRTSWCGYCKKAAAYLKAKGVRFVEKDIEKDPSARQDMLTRAQRAGVPASALQGVPILAVKGRIITGFDRGAIDRALGG